MNIDKLIIAIWILLSSILLIENMVIGVDQALLFLKTWVSIGFAMFVIMIIWIFMWYAIRWLLSKKWWKKESNNEEYY